MNGLRLSLPGEPCSVPLPPGADREARVDITYRGHAIRVIRAGGWQAVAVELDSGATLPTKVSALANEGRPVLLRRACELIDVYIAAQAARGAGAACAGAATRC